MKKIVFVIFGLPAIVSFGRKLLSLHQSSTPTKHGELSSRPKANPSPPLSQRELAVQGFSKRYAELMAEGNYDMAEYIADEAFKFSQLTDKQFLLRFPDPVQ